nr:MAG TPA: hypothetical protein [Caudoviricetes sp.]
MIFKNNSYNYFLFRSTIRKSSVMRRVENA